MAGNASKPGVSVASRTLALLGAFDAAHRRLSLTDMARRADLPVPTAYRLVNELQRWGALTRTSSGDYVIGRRLWDVGLLAPMQTGLREVASPFLHDLYGATLATVHLAVREGTNALYIERLSGHASVPVVSKIGTRLPMHATGVGKVLLAHAPEAIRTDVLAHLTRLTAHTVIHSGVLRNQLSRVHRDGYATTVEEMTLGACSVAVPVYRGDDVVAALGVVVPSLNRDKLRLVSALNVAAQGISRSLG
ncbi:MULTISPECIES: IclR family transcriptional regulator [Mycobacteriaceae]|uniref:IclR family transcriptional regulator n=1 Tax=Mycobacteriaceae TaxID=1762 RepID=UPI0009A5D73B|nr:MULTISPECIES: IclR family transcriptional regulator [Mycobacteriaceae]MDX1881680.1 IclR family transcriptional regulator [Mycolicibacterium sp. 141076]RIT45866.1 IclR family transcriptional regulator [Mycobacteroides abscessus]UCZ59378.1 IclR family transcriptional regulator [Mycolicibacterium phocaicum]SKT75576.1 transcriptional regulator [Mycobacteroides abscessus subsp. massiliense]SKU01063.1 transcriptional regulator [Mycobacteroides abscessus subsp. massiliense]